MNAKVTAIMKVLESIKKILEGLGYRCNFVVDPLGEARGRPLGEPE